MRVQNAPRRSVVPESVDEPGSTNETRAQGRDQVDGTDSDHVASTPIQSNAVRPDLCGFPVLRGSIGIDRKRPCFRWSGISGTEPIRSRDVQGIRAVGSRPVQRYGELRQRISQLAPKEGCSCSTGGELGLLR